MKKTLWSVIPTTLLAAALLLASPAIDSAHAHPSSFPDVAESHPAHDAVESMVASGVVTGTEAGLFLPDDPLTRGQAAKMIVSWRPPALPSAAASAGSPSPGAVFSDVDDTFAPYVSLALAAGWVRGYPDGTFRPGLPIARGQMATIVIRSLGLEERARGLTDEQIALALRRFVDGGAVTPESRPYVALAVGYGLLAGDAGRLNPGEAVTRAQFCMVLSRAGLLAERLAMGEVPIYLVDDASSGSVGGGAIPGTGTAATEGAAIGASEGSAAGAATGSAAGSTWSAEQLALAAFMDEVLFKPHSSPVTGEMVLQNAEWYGIPPLSQLVIMAAETSLGDPRLGGTLAQHNNFGCLRYHGADTPWGVLSDGRIWVAGYDWYSFPSPDVGMAAFGRYLKVGANGFYLPILTSPNPDWERFAAVYYGSGVSGFSSYVSRLYSLERSFRASAARYGVSF